MSTSPSTASELSAVDGSNNNNNEIGSETAFLKPENPVGSSEDSQSNSNINVEKLSNESETNNGKVVSSFSSNDKSATTTTTTTLGSTFKNSSTIIPHHQESSHIKPENSLQQKNIIDLKSSHSNLPPSDSENSNVSFRDVDNYQSYIQNTIPQKMGPKHSQRRVWIQRPGSVATSVFVQEFHLIGE